MIFRLSLTTSKSTITNFIECKNAGYPIMESYPAQCRDESGHNFVEEIGDNPINIPTTETAEFNKTVSLNLHEKAAFPDGSSVTLTEINDSRCKLGVQCIWAGELSATFTLSRGSDFQKEIILGTLTAPSMAVKEYTFSLQEITEKSATITVNLTIEESSKPASNFRTRCESAVGTWSDHYNGCLGVEGSDCANIGGKFDLCAANCSITPDGEVCTNGCLRICRM